MADIKISDLPVAASVVLADYIPCVIAAGPTTNRVSFTVVRAALLPIVLTADVSGVLPTGNVATMLTGKTLTTATIVLASNTVTDTSAATGDLAKHNGTSFVRFARGSSYQTLRTNAAGTNLEWAALDLATAAVTGVLLPTNGGTGVSSLGSNVDTFLGTSIAVAFPTFAGTPSSANLRSLLNDETGTGGAVFATAPTITDPAIDGGRIEASSFRFKGETTNNGTGTLNNVSLGGNRVVRFTNGAGAVVTGFDATGVEAGEQVLVICEGGSIQFTDQTGSSAANQMLLAGGGPWSAFIQSSFLIFYDATAQKWRLPAALGFF